MDNAARVYVCTNPEHPASFLEKLNQQRVKGIHCDATIKVQGHLFRTHINVLSATLGYFKDIFSKTLMNNLPLIVDIPDIVNSTGFSKVLDYVYTSNLSLSQNTVMETLCSACFLQSPFVVKKCQEFIQTHGFVPAADYPKNNVEAWLSTLPKHTQRNQINQEIALYEAQRKSNFLMNNPHNGHSLESIKYKPVIEYPVRRNKFPRTLSNDEVARSENLPTTYYTTSQTNTEDNFETTPIDHKSLADYFANETKQQTAMADQSQHHHSLKLLGDTVDDATSKASNLQNNSNNSTNYEENSEKRETNSFTFTNKKEKPKKEYTCEVCLKQFGRQQHLKRHILTHTGERPYPCHMCDKRFRRSEHLKHHMASHAVPLITNQMSPKKRICRNPEDEDIYTFSKYILNCASNRGCNLSTSSHLQSITSVSAPNCNEETKINSNNFKNDSEVDDWKNKNSETSIKEITTGVNRGALNLMKKPKKAANPRRFNQDVVVDENTSDDVESTSASSPNGIEGSHLHADKSYSVSLNYEKVQNEKKSYDVIESSFNLTATSNSVINSSEVLENKVLQKTNEKKIKQEEVFQNSSDIKKSSNILNSSNNLIDFDQSEVMTPDLKRLMLAMTET